MSIQNILRMGNPGLYQRSEEVTDLQAPELDQIVTDMLDTMRKANGVGIAAPQIGIHKRIIIFGFDHNPRYPKAQPVPLTVLINPVVQLQSEDTHAGWEGCLSIPGLRGLVPRYKTIKYSGYDFINKQHIERVVDGFHAIVVQHEVDHINGSLYVSRISDLQQFGFEGESLINP